MIGAAPWSMPPVPAAEISVTESAPPSPATCVTPSEPASLIRPSARRVIEPAATPSSRSIPARKSPKTVTSPGSPASPPPGGFEVSATKPVPSAIAARTVVRSKFESAPPRSRSVGSTSQVPPGPVETSPATLSVAPEVSMKPPPSAPRARATPAKSRCSSAITTVSPPLAAPETSSRAPSDTATRRARTSMRPPSPPRAPISPASRASPPGAETVTAPPAPSARSAETTPSTETTLSTMASAEAAEISTSPPALTISPAWAAETPAVASSNSKAKRPSPARSTA